MKPKMRKLCELWHLEVGDKLALQLRCFSPEYGGCTRISVGQVEQYAKQRQVELLPIASLMAAYFEGLWSEVAEWGQRQ